jgi:hypothetical protein
LPNCCTPLLFAPVLAPVLVFPLALTPEFAPAPALSLGPLSPLLAPALLDCLLLPSGLLCPTPSIADETKLLISSSARETDPPPPRPPFLSPCCSSQLCCNLVAGARRKAPKTHIMVDEYCHMCIDSSPRPKGMKKRISWSFWYSGEGDVGVVEGDHPEGNGLGYVEVED